MTDVIPTRTRSLRKAFALAVAVPLAASLALPVVAQDNRPERPRMEAGMHGERGDDRGRMERGYRHGEHGRDRDRDHGPRRWHGPAFGERLAMRLAAAENAAGIKTAQLDAWRTFSAALVDFATFQRPSMGPRDADDEMDDEAMAPGDDEPAVTDGGEAAEAPAAPGPGPGASSGMDLLDRLIARAENRAEKAARLKAAKTALEAVLEPGQKQIIQRYLTPHRFGMHGGHGGR